MTRLLITDTRASPADHQQVCLSKEQQELINVYFVSIEFYVVYYAAIADTICMHIVDLVELKS